MEFAPKTADYVLTVSHPALPNGHILAVEKTLTLSDATLGIDLSQANIWTAAQTMTKLNLTDSTNQLVFDSQSMLSKTTLKDTGGLGNITVALPGVTGTLASLAGTQSFTGRKTFDAGLDLNDNDKLTFGTGNDATIIYDGTDLIIDPRVVGSGKLKLKIEAGDLRMGGTLFANTADSNEVVNTTTETNFDQNVDIPADGMLIGQVIKVTARGKLDKTGLPTLRLRIKLGSTVVIDGPATIAGTVEAWEIYGTIHVRSLGASGTVMANGYYNNGRNHGPLSNQGTTTIDTTAIQTVQVSAQWSVADALNTITLENIEVEVLDFVA